MPTSTTSTFYCIVCGEVYAFANDDHSLNEIHSPTGQANKHPTHPYYVDMPMIKKKERREENVFKFIYSQKVHARAANKYTNHSVSAINYIASATHGSERVCVCYCSVNMGSVRVSGRLFLCPPN